MGKAKLVDFNWEQARGCWVEEYRRYPERMGPGLTECHRRLRKARAKKDWGEAADAAKALQVHQSAIDEAVRNVIEI